jgi:hypothetical protein
MADVRFFPGGGHGDPEGVSGSGAVRATGLGYTDQVGRNALRSQ